MIDRVVHKAGISGEQIKEVTLQENEELKKREKYGAARRKITLQGKMVSLVGGGPATMASMKAAISTAREHDPKKIIVAISNAP